MKLLANAVSRRHGLLVVVLALILLSTSLSGPPTWQAGPGGLQAAPIPQASPQDRDVFHGVQAGITGEGWPYLGSSDAPLTVEEYTDFLCPFCARHATQTFPSLLERYVAQGRLRYVFRDMPLASLHPTAAKGHAAARCVADQGAPLFWAMHEGLFRAQDQWRSLPDPAPYLEEEATKVGVDKAAYQACVSSGRMDSPVQEGVAAGQALGFNGTPSFRFTRADGKSYTLVGAQPLATFSQWMDALLAGNDPPQEAAPQPQQPQELPLWANARGLAPDPTRPGFNLAGDPYKGNPEAALAVVEFSNFQCPSCRTHALEVAPVIDSAMVDTGQVMWVFKNLPLRSLPQSAVAAVAAECAGEQGRYWEMNRALFGAQGRWAVEAPDPPLIELAGELGLETGTFSACLGGRHALEKVMEDMYDAQGVANTTPTFVILHGGKGTVMRGSKPANQFIATLQGLMRSDPAPSPAP